MSSQADRGFRGALSGNIYLRYILAGSGNMPLSSATLGTVKDTLLAGGYSLFLGAGASFGSKDVHDIDLPLSDELRQGLIALKGLNPKSPLSRAYAQLTQREIDTHITDRFSRCTPGAALLKIPDFIWKRIYTLNVDDALEAAYEKTPHRQTSDPKTQRAPYVDATDVNSVQLIHIHGWARKPEDGYVFSLADYAKTMGPNSPWTTVLAHTMATEPYIIAGTTLEEPDRGGPAVRDRLAAWLR